jgi:hypothetical protein
MSHQYIDNIGQACKKQSSTTDWYVAFSELHNVSALQLHADNFYLKQVKVIKQLNIEDVQRDISSTHK